MRFVRGGFRLDAKVRRWLIGGAAAFAAAALVSGALYGIYVLLHDMAPRWADPALSDAARAADIGRIRSAILAVTAGVIAVASATVAALSLRHAIRVHRVTQDNETARRSNELYAAAAAQLGSEHPAVRLAGFYSFERLAEQEPGFRQTIVDVWCAYLRMPPESSEQDGAPAQREEEVRLTVQRVLERHLKREATGHWSDVLNLNLNGATLTNLDLRGAGVAGTLDLRHATLRGASRFDNAVFRQSATFSEAHFTDYASFHSATFEERVNFADAKFDGPAQFRFVKFVTDASFVGAVFKKNALFAEAVFGRGALFANTVFKADAGFLSARFDGKVVHQTMTITGDGGIHPPTMSQGAVFSNAAFTYVSFSGAQIDRGAVFAGATYSKRLVTVSGREFEGHGEGLPVGDIHR